MIWKASKGRPGLRIGAFFVLTTSCNKLEGTQVQGNPRSRRAAYKRFWRVSGLVQEQAPSGRRPDLTVVSDDARA